MSESRRAAVSAPWIALRVRAEEGVRDAVIATLFEAGSLGVQEDGDVVLTHLTPGSDVEAVRRAVLRADARASVDVAETPDVDWSEAWKAGVAAQNLGRLVVAPPWLAGDFDSARLIVIDPGMAFGTGDHPTTRGILRLMQRVIVPGQSVADLGAGSAVLGIAAAKLGAARVAAVELDEEAISNAEENVARNEVADRVTVVQGDAALLLPLLAPVDVVLANIISSVIADLLPAIADALTPGGRAVVAGILADERQGMLDVLGGAGWSVLEEDREELWWSASIGRR